MILEEDAKPRSRYPYIVEHDVEPAEPLDSAGHRPHDVALLRNVALFGNGDTAGGFDKADRLLGPIEIDIDAEDLGALLGKT